MLAGHHRPPPATAVVDVICLIPGCHVLIVLRKVWDNSCSHEESVQPLNTKDAPQKGPIQDYHRSMLLEKHVSTYSLLLLIFG